MNKNDYTIYHMAHGQFLQKHSLKCHLLPDEKIELFNGTGYPSFSKAINTCVTNCPTETIIIFSYKVYPFPDEIEKILFYLNKGYALVGLYRLAFIGFKKELFRKIGFFDERFILGGCEDDDFLIRIREANLSFYMSHESIISNEYSSWTSQYKERPTASYKHFLAKWKQFPEGKRRQFSEEKYEYDLGVSTGETFLPWNQSLLCTYSYEDGQNNRDALYNPFNIEDRKLAVPPHSKKRSVTRYTVYNNYFREPE